MATRTTALEMNLSQKERLAYREQVARELGVLLDPPLSFRAAKFAARHKTRADLVKWLKHENTPNCWQMGRKTYVELCMAFGLDVSSNPTLHERRRELAAARARVVELEQELAHFMESVNGKTLTVKVATAEQSSVDQKEMQI